LLRCGAHLERFEASRKKVGRATIAQSRMPSSCPKGKRSAVSSFLPSKVTTDNEKHTQTAAEKGNQMRSKGSNEVVGRIDTRVAQNAQGVVKGVMKGVTRASFGRRAPLTPQLKRASVRRREEKD